MTIETEISRSGPYAGAGTTGPFLVNFRILDATHLRVVKLTTLGEVTLAYPADYLVTGVGNPTSSLTTIVAVALGETLTIIRDVPKTQEADYVQNDDFPAQTHEDALDKLTMIVQQISEEVDRSLTLPVSAATASTELPTPEANALIGWNQTADALQNVDPATLATIVAFASWQSQLFNGTGAQTVFVLSSAPGSINNLDIIISGVGQRAGIDYALSGSTLTFTTAPPVGVSNIFVRWGQALPQGTSDDSQVSVTQPFAGAVARTQHDKNAESYSIQDAGGVSGVDCATAVTTLSAATRAVYFPAGSWLAALTPTITGNSVLRTAIGAVMTGAGMAALGFTAGAMEQRIHINTTGTDFATQYIRRNASHAGGAFGFSSSALRVDTFAGAGTTNFEWALTSVLYNYATGTSQNVGAYLLGNKMVGNAGPTWGACIDLEETVATNNPTSQSIGLEVDVRSNGTDANKVRVGLDVACTRHDTAGVATTTAFGVRVQTNRDGANSTVGVAYSIDGPSTNVGIGFDTSLATITQAAFKMAQGQLFAFNAAATRTLSYTGGGWAFGAGGTNVATVVDSGAFWVGANQVLGGRIVGWGAATNGSRAALNGATATLPQTSAALAALIIDLTTHGLIGP